MQIFRRVLMWASLVAVLLYILLSFGTLLYDSLPKQSLSDAESTAVMGRLQTEISLAESKWKSHNITNYDIDVEIYIHNSTCGTGDEGSTLRIRQGRLDLSDETTKNVEDECNISRLLPPAVFDTVRKMLTEDDCSLIWVDFDPEYGFLVKMHIESNYRISDLNVSYAFSNFRPYDP